MKLKLSIPTRPNLMHMLPSVDALALLFVLPLLVSQVDSSGGHEVVLPESSLRLPTADHAVVVEVLPGPPLQVWVGKELVATGELDAKFAEIKEKWNHGGNPLIWFKLDKRISIEQAALVRNKLFEQEFTIREVGKYITRDLEDR